MLPKSFRKQWRGARVYMSIGPQDIFIKKMQSPSLTQLRSKLKEIGAQIKKSDIAQAIREVRAKGRPHAV